MKFKYRLSDGWIARVSEMDEFANGATQVTVKLKDGREIPAVLVSAATYLVAARGFKDLPFKLDDIVDICQSDEDKNPQHRGDWDFWDKWE